MNSHPRTLSAKPLLWPLIANRFSRLFSRLSGFSGGMSVDWSPSHPLLLFLALVPALLFSALLTPAPLSAAPKSLDEALAESGAPPELAAWAPWALYDTEDRFCPKELSGEKRCLLPISLEIEVTESGGSFAGRWELKDKALVTLPGQADRWPSQVAASESGGEAKLIPVVGSDLPQVWLEAGSYEIKGAFKWDSPPETLSVPLGPILSVTSLGRKLSFPALDEEPSRGVARIWLKGRESAPAPSQEQEGNRLAVQVDRLVVDSLPMSYRTRLRLIVTGTSREETIKDPLLPDSVPAFLQSALPARIVGGDLRAQVSPGVHDIFIDSRLKERSDSIGPASGRFGVERWAFVARPYLRQVEVSGAPQIDNSLVDVEWDALPITSLDVSASLGAQEAGFRDYVTYELREGESLNFTEIRRGDPEPSPDNLMLDRRCWLDYDGRGLTCRDTLTGTMRRNFHLSVDQPFSLGQATLNGVPQVITWQRNSKGQSAPGLQLRQGALHLTADLRIEGFDHALPASGWDHNLDRTNQFLVLPPGYELLRVSGAMALDRFYGPSAWWDRWNAFDMFMVLAVVLAALKLLGLPWAILALAAMSLSYHEFLAPRLVLLHVLGATALLAVLPPGKASLAARIWRIGSVIFMIFCAAALIILQARLAMYPQLENPDVRRTGPGWPLLSRTFLPDSFESLQYAPYAADDAGVEAASFEGMAMEAPAPMAERAMRKNVAAPPPPEPFLSQTSRPKAASLIAQSLNPELMAQNTLARPEWGFRLISLDFNDQVSKDQRAELSIIGPGANKLLRILRIVLLAWLVLALAAGRSGPRGFLGPLARLVPKPGGSKGTPPGPGAEGGAVQDAGAAKKSHEPMAPTQGAGRAPGPPSGQGHSLTASQSATPGQALAGLSALVLSSFSGFFSIAKHSLSSFFASLPPFFLAAILSIAALSGSAWAQDAFPSYEAEGPASSAAAKPQAPTAAPPAFSSGLFPSPELLRELKERLLKEEVLPAPSIPLISIGPGEASGSIRLRVDFEAAESSLLPLPIIDEEIARFTKVYLSSTGGDLPLARGRDSVVLALIPEGADSVVIDCLLLPSPGFQLRFSLIPKRVELLSLPGYSLQGLGPEGHPLAGSVFVETGKIEEAPESEVDQALASGGQSLEPFFMVDRVLSLGLDWKVMTTVTRYGNAGAPATVSIPLLESESPTTMGLTVSGGRAVLNFRPGESHKFFESSYPVNLDSELTLTASDGPYAESWRLDAANIWRVETSSLVPIHTLSPDGLFNPQWRPWPGESLTLKVTRPEPVPGAYLVIDKATVKTVAGEENRKHTLTASLRSSKGGAHSIFLPAGVEIQSFSLGGKTLPIGAPLSSNRGLEVSVPLVPGEKTLEIAFLETADLEAITRMPAIDLGLPSANIHYELDLPDDRWLLFARGPIQGPAVLFWSFAGAMLVLSLLLARIGSTPLGTISWLLILVGLSQLSLAGAFVVAGWLLALGLRGSKPPLKDAQSFNAAQILLAFWTIVALVLIYQGLQHALLEAPSMRVAGNASTEHQLRWFADRAQGPLPDAWALTISNKVYQFVMLAWALWLAISIIRWLRWGWRCFSSEGFWRKEPKAPKPPKSPRGPAGPPPGFGPPPGSPPPQGYGPPPQGYGPPPQGGSPPPQGYGPPPQGGSPPPQGFGPPPSSGSPPQAGSPPPQGYGPPPSSGSPPQAGSPPPQSQGPPPSGPPLQADSKAQSGPEAGQAPQGAPPGQPASGGQPQNSERPPWPFGPLGPRKPGA